MNYSETVVKFYNYGRCSRLQWNNDQTAAHIIRINSRPNMNILHSYTFAHNFDVTIVTIKVLSVTMGENWSKQPGVQECRMWSSVKLWRVYSVPDSTRCKHDQSRLSNPTAKHQRSECLFCGFNHSHGEFSLTICFVGTLPWLPPPPPHCEAKLSNHTILYCTYAATKLFLYLILKPDMHFLKVL